MKDIIELRLNQTTSKITFFSKSRKLHHPKLTFTKDLIKSIFDSKRYRIIIRWKTTLSLSLERRNE